MNRREFLGKSAISAAALTLGGLSKTALANNANATPTIAGMEEALAAAKAGQPIPAKGLAAFSSDFHFAPHSFTRHALGDSDILVEILYAGICHSDLHSVAGDHHPPQYPLVPGHEILGRVIAIGKNVKKFKIGDFAGIGCMVNSCGECAACKASEEQFCLNAKTVFTYNSADVFHGGALTYGGYSNNIVLTEKFAIRVPKTAHLEKVAPLLCAGITTYSPIRFSKVSAGQKVAVAGVGGLGHMALKYMVALGAEVTGFDIVAAKKDRILSLGAKHFVDVNSPEFKSIANEFDFIISTIPYHYDINAYHKMLKRKGEMAIVGLPKESPALNANAMIWQFQRKIYSSLIGGIAETQEMLDFSVAHNIYPEIELISVKDIDAAYQKVAAGKADFRMVLDMKTL